MQPVGVILLRHGDKLSGGFRHDAQPHLRAAIAAIRRHEVPVRYSNIHLMKLANLLMLGEAVGDAGAVAEGRAWFDAWFAFTRANGITEYDSPTYTPIQADSLVLVHDLTGDAALKKRLRAALDFYWADLAANYFAPRQTMTGPASRNYNQGFLFSDSNVEYAYYLAGLRPEAPGDTLPSDLVRAWVAARMEGYRPPPGILAIAAQPRRVIRSRFGALPGQDRYEWITPEFSIGSASAYHGPQDRRICVELGSERRLPLAGFVVDSFDAPYGLVRTTDRGGHSKPHHLPHVLATVQEKGFLMALVDVSPATRTGEFTNLASNLVFPARGVEVRLDGQRVDTSKPFSIVAGARSVVVLREGKAAVAMQIFDADGCLGQTPVWTLDSDGNQPGAGRLAVHHYRGPARNLAGQSIRCGLWILAGRCANDREFAAFLKRAARIRPTESTSGGQWMATAKSGAVELEAGLDLSRQQIVRRAVNGVPWRAEVLQVNGKDWATATLGR
jgi:hypothetical protein